jgi:hypothetical protein
MALLRSGVKNLRGANNILSRRRREKETRLENGDKIIVEEGQASIDEKDVDRQVVAESLRRGGWAKSVQSRV